MNINTAGFVATLALILSTLINSWVSDKHEVKPAFWVQCYILLPSALLLILYAVGQDIVSMIEWFYNNTLIYIILSLLIACSVGLGAIIDSYIILRKYKRAKNPKKGYLKREQIKTIIKDGFSHNRDTIQGGYTIGIRFFMTLCLIYLAHYVHFRCFGY